ncbi:MAG: hypothetical protein RL213_1103 [Bacteroidota bacterium]|jgi:hypothetical protein
MKKFNIVFRTYLILLVFNFFSCKNESAYNNLHVDITVPPCSGANSNSYDINKYEVIIYNEKGEPMKLDAISHPLHMSSTQFNDMYELEVPVGSISKVELNFPDPGTVGVSYGQNLITTKKNISCSLSGRTSLKSHVINKLDLNITFSLSGTYVLDPSLTATIED